MPLERHPRSVVVHKAEIELSDFIGDLVDTYHLTYGELTHVLSMELCKWSRYQIKDERDEDRS